MAGSVAGKPEHARSNVVYISRLSVMTTLLRTWLAQWSGASLAVRLTRGLWLLRRAGRLSHVGPDLVQECAALWAHSHMRPDSQESGLVFARRDLL